MSAVDPQSGTWDELAREATLRRQGGDKEVDLIREFLAFDVGDTVYAVAIERVREILRMRPITPVPRVPEMVVGVVSIRGEIVEVLDLRRRLGLSAIETNRRTRIVVVHGDDGRVTGCMVDQVRQVLRIPERMIRPPAEADMENVSGLCEWDDEFVSMLDLDQVLDLERTR